MRFILYILITIVFFTSCRSSFTKRQYRPGIFTEQLKGKNVVSLRKQNQYLHNIASISKSKSNLNLSFGNSDSVVKYSTQFGKGEEKVKSIKGKNLVNSKKIIHSKIKSGKIKSTVLPEDTKEGKLRKARNGVGLAILICAILFGIGFLIGGLTAYLDYALILILISGGLGIALILVFLILEIIRQSFINKKLKNEKIKELSDKRLYRFKKNYDKLKSLNVVAIIFTIIGLLTFLVTETGFQTILAWSLLIGLVISLFVLIRVIIMIYEYRKNKELLSETEIKDYKKVRNLSLVIASLFLAAAIFIGLVFILV